MEPKRIQRKRTKGWRMPEGTVYVGRGSKWGNPYKVGEHNPMMIGKKITADSAVQLYEWYAAEIILKDKDWLSGLEGKDLACWCALDQPCHADVLLRWANMDIVAHLFG